MKPKTPAVLNSEEKDAALAAGTLKHEPNKEVVLARSVRTLMQNCKKNEPTARRILGLPVVSK